MGWHVAAFELLARWTVQSTVVLAVATLAVACVRQPVQRIRLIQGAFLMCLALPCLALVERPADLSWHLPAMTSRRDIEHLPITAQGGSRPLLLDELRPDPSSTAISAPDISRSDDQHHEVVRSTIDEATDRNASVASGVLRPSSPQTVTRIDLKWWCVVGYLAGVTGMVGWWCAGLVALRRLLRRSRPADARCQAVWRAVAAGRAAGARLVVSPTAKQPFVSGWRGPIVVLPEGLARGDERDLRWSLAHESSHALRSDAWWWSLAGLLRVLLFHQPLVWWLRGRLRLSQDFLADADAAAHGPAAEDYAQFLTDWARGSGVRPISFGLGMVGRKSDLYRRVTMLVQDRRLLDRRCSRRWTIIALGLGMMVVAAVSTYGDAADPPAAKDAAERADTEKKPAVQPATKGEDGRAQQLVDGVLKRAGAIRSGEFRFHLQAYDPQQRIMVATANRTRVVLSGDDFRVLEWDGDTVKRGNRLMKLGRQQDFDNLVLSIREAGANEAEQHDRLLPLRAGTLPNPASARFVTRHRDRVRLTGETSLEQTSGEQLATATLEWDVSADEAKEVFAGASELLQQGGVLRLYVASQFNSALPRVEYVDRFGMVQARFEASGFREAAPGLFFPGTYKISQGRVDSYAFDVIDLVNRPIGDDQFVIAPIDAGTRVVDHRRPRDAAATGPLRSFTVGFMYEKGLPEALLAEMDRNVLPAEEPAEVHKPERSPAALESGASAPREKAAEAPVHASDELGYPRRQAPLGAHSVATPVDPRDELRYAGRTFDQWRAQLLNDLDEATCTTAMPAIVAFAKRGYAEEAVAALAKLLRAESDVSLNATMVLAQIGTPALPAFVDGLTDKLASVRSNSAAGLEVLGADAKPAVGALVTLLKTEKNPDVHRVALKALVALACDDEELRPQFEQIVDSRSTADRKAVLAGLWRRGPPLTGYFLRLVLQCSEDEDSDIRSEAAYLLARYGAADKETIDRVKALLRDVDDDVQVSTLTGLLKEHTDATLAARMLAYALVVPDARNRLRSQGGFKSAIERLAQAPQQADTTVPVLTGLIDRQSGNVLSTVETRSAIQALGKLGPAARAAIPTLKRVAEGTLNLGDLHAVELAKRALQKITSEDPEPPAARAK